MWTDLQSFYKSNEWTGLLEVLKLERTDSSGNLICEHCGNPIVKKYDCIGHHKEALTLANVNNANISLNPDNIAFVHFRCHNEIHNRFGKYTRHIYLVYGCACSGKSTFVRENKTPHDIVVDIDRLYSAISGEQLYIKSNRLYDNVMSVQRCLLDDIKRRHGKWVNAWIIGGLPYAYSRDREDICARLGAEPIYIECTQDEAFRRLQANPDGRDVKAWEQYIKKWFDTFQA